MCTNTGRERREQPLGVQHEMCVVLVGLHDPGGGVCEMNARGMRGHMPVWWLCA